MPYFQIESHEKVIVLKLNRGITNAINLEFINELGGIIEKATADSNVNGIVVTSSNEKFFSIGFDIPELFGLSKEDFGNFYGAFNQLSIALYTLPKPSIAVITGHAIAGGCILALCCDYRFIAEGRKLMGLNEIKLGVPIPYPADCILRSIVGTRNAREITDTGDFYEPEQLHHLGMVDKILPIEKVLPESIKKANHFGSFPAQAFEMIKQNRIEMVRKQILEHLAEKEKYFIECWYSNEVRKRLKEASKKF
jgi:enoyl-CoA hydratase/carnithine racemase